MIFDDLSFEKVCNTVADEYENCLENIECLHINRMPARVNLIPAQKAGVFYENKEESDMLLCLNGDYKFRYELADVIPDFYSVDFSDSDWDMIDVPSMWQYRGYGECVYSNVRYPIPFNPPYVDCENPVGYYRRTFELAAVPDNAILHFGGVDNAFFVYINGEFVGFSKGSRIPAEFDVKSFLKKGINTLCVKVFTYSDATYVENQDMLMASGIFRDVYLLKLNKIFLQDMYIVPEDDVINVDLTLNSDDCSGYDVCISVAGHKVVLPAQQHISYAFKIDNPMRWNAEEPNLYTVVIELLKDNNVAEIHTKKVGFVKTEVVGNKILVNGRPIYIKGINRHEYDCKNGRSITVKQIRDDLTRIKENNFNAIRCAHYTNNPAFYEIASELGLYVMDEADLETHGCNEAGDQGYLSKTRAWFPVYYDRTSRMFEQQKNETCIIMWSTGNECGRGENINRCIEYLKESDHLRVVLSAQDTSELSTFRLCGYRSIEGLNQIAESVEGAPVLMIEYAHAMGNSPGGLEDYWNYVYAHEQVAGGYVWEFKNHGFYCEDENRKPFYKFGGDFTDDYSTWFNFCLDGFLTSDGTPKPTWYEAKEALSPVYVTYDGKINIRNTNDFRTLEYLALKWEICEDYTVIRCGEMQLPAVAPRESFISNIDLTIEKPIPGAEYMVNLIFSDGDRIVSNKQIKLNVFEVGKSLLKPSFDCNISGDHRKLTVCGENFEIVFDNGLIANYKINEKNLITNKMKLNFYRAPIDNDGVFGLVKRYIGVWEDAYLEHFKFHMRGMSVKKETSSILITVKGKACARAKYVGFAIEIGYEILKNGLVIVSMKYDPYGEIPAILPRVGVMFEIDKDTSEIQWYGRGPLQSYADAKLAANFGMYQSDKDHINFMFDYPQETGNHENTRFLRLENGFSVVGSKEFAFSYHPYEMKTLIDSRHLNEVEESKRNYLYIDYKMRGIGSRACGPDPEPEHEFFSHSFQFVFALMHSENTDNVLKVSRCDMGEKTERLSENYTFQKAQRFEVENAECDVE